MEREVLFAGTFFCLAWAAGAVGPALTCEDTAAAAITELPKPCILDPVNGSLRYESKLPGLKDTRFYRMVTVMRVLGEAPGGNATTAALCLGLKAFSKVDIYDPVLAGSINQLTSFDPHLAVGILHIDRHCWEAKHTNCTHRTWLRADVLAVPPVTYTPDDASFWAWVSEPLLAAPAAWVRGLLVECLETPASRGNVRFAWTAGLANSSLRALRLRGLRFNVGEVPPRAFGDMPLLRTVAVVDCNVPSLSPANATTHDCFAGSEGVERLVLNDNWLAGLPECVGRLRALRTLHVLRNDVGGAGLFALRPATLAPLALLRELRVEACALGNLTEPLPPLPALAALSLRDCRLSSLPPAAFQALPALQKLDLSDNFLRLPPGALLLGARSLALLDLHNASLAQWPPLKDVHVQLLNLSLNALSSVTNLGSGGVSVDDLDLSGNRISSWGDAGVFSLGAGAWSPRVNLSRNRIAAVDTAMGLALDALAVVDLGANELYCDDCRTPATQRWLNATKTVVLALGCRAPLRCKDPLRLRGMPVVHVGFDETQCQSPQQRLLLGIGVPLLVCLCLAVAVTGASYYYRLEIIYMMHLAKVRQNARRSDKDDSHCIYDAFVCYSGRNRRWVMRELVPSLERGPERFRLCLHDRDFRLGAHIVDSIVDSIDRSRKVLVVLTPHFVASAWCQWELDMAQHRVLSEARRDLLVLLRLGEWGREEEQALPPLLRFLLATRGAVAWPARASRRQARAAARRLRRALAPSLFQTGRRPNQPSNEDHNTHATEVRPSHNNPPSFASRLRRFFSFRDDNDPLTSSGDDDDDDGLDPTERIGADDVADAADTDAQHPWFLQQPQPSQQPDDTCFTAQFGDRECLVQRDIDL